MSGPPASSKINLYPLLFLAAAFAVGILIETAFQASLWSLTAGIASVSFAAYLLREDTIGTILVIIAFLMLGAFCSCLEVSSVADNRIRSLIDTGLVPSGAPLELEGTLTEPSQPSAEGFISTIEVQSIRFRGQTRSASGRVRIYLLIPDDQAAAEYERLELHTALTFR